MSMAARADASGAVLCSHAPDIDHSSMARHIVLAPAPMRLQKLTQIYCTMVLPIR
jgi:hypothetical protein